MVHWTEDVFVEEPELFLDDLEHRSALAQRQVEAVLDTLDNRYDLRPDRLLDVGCGLGRHVVEFARAGVEAHGLDISEEYLDYAAAAAREAGVESDVTLFHHDMRNVAELAGTYDLITNFYTSFGFYDDETNAGIVADLRDRLEPGGVFLIQATNKDGALSLGFVDDGVLRAGDQLYAETREYDPETSRISITRRVFDEADDEYEGRFDYSLRLYSPVELRALFRDAGFEEVALFGSVDGESLATDSRQVVVVGRKAR